MPGDHVCLRNGRYDVGGVTISMMAPTDSVGRALRVFDFAASFRKEWRSSRRRSRPASTPVTSDLCLRTRLPSRGPCGPFAGDSRLQPSPGPSARRGLHPKGVRRQPDLPRGLRDAGDPRRPHITQLATSISEKGGRPALGLMAIPISRAARFNPQPMDPLDACTNVSIGTAVTYGP